MDTYKAKYTLFKHYIYTNSIFLYHVGMPLFTFFVPISSLSMFYMCIIHFLLNSRIGSEGHFWNFWNIPQVETPCLIRIILHMKNTVFTKNKFMGSCTWSWQKATNIFHVHIRVSIIVLLTQHGL